MIGRRRWGWPWDWVFEGDIGGEGRGERYCIWRLDGEYWQIQRIRSNLNDFKRCLYT